MKDGTARHAWPCGYGTGATHLRCPDAAGRAPCPVGQNRGKTAAAS